MPARFMSAFRRIAVSAAVAAAAIAPASAADLVAPGPYVAVAPDSLCGETGHLRQIHRGFRTQAREVHHQPELSILEINDFYENRYSPGYDNDLDVLPNVNIPRVYCRATAYMSDGQTRTLWYLVEYGEGFAGVFGDNVEFCLSGLDRWNVYNGGCRVVR